MIIYLPLCWPQSIHIMKVYSYHRIPAFGHINIWKRSWFSITFQNPKSLQTKMPMQDLNSNFQIGSSRWWIFWIQSLLYKTKCWCKKKTCNFLHWSEDYVFMKDYVAPRLKCMLNVCSAVCVLRFSFFIGLCSIPIMQITWCSGGKENILPFYFVQLLSWKETQLGEKLVAIQ